jgi:tetratricopeptide (TPR) repeat protein
MFAFSYAWIFKGYFLTLLGLALICFARSRTRLQKGWHLGFAWFCASLVVTSARAYYDVRTTSGLDIFLGAVALTYLFYRCGPVQQMQLFREIGVFLLAITATSLAVYVAQDPPFPYTYNVSNLWQNIVGRPWRTVCTIKDILRHARLPNHYPLEYSNFTGIFAFLSLPFFVGLLFYDTSRRWKNFWGVAALLSLLELRSAKCDAAYFLTIFNGLAALLLWTIARENLRWRRICAVGAIGVLLAVGIVWAQPALKSRVYTLLNNGVPHFLGTRYHTMKQGWGLFLQRPWFGHGFHNTGPLYFEAFFKSSSPAAFGAWQFHFTPVQILVDWGIVGTLGLLGIIGSFLFMWGRLFFRTRSRDKILATAAVLALVAYCGEFADWSLNIFCIVATLTLTTATLYHLYCKHFLAQRRGNMIGLKLVCGVLMGYILFYSYRDIYSRYLFDKGVRESSLDSSEKYIREAIRQDPHNLYYHNQLGNLLAMLVPRRPELYDRAVEAFKQSLKVTDYQIYPHANLGALYTFGGDYERAYDHYYRAIELNPTKSLSYIQLAHILYLHHFDTLADRWAACACFAHPYLIRCAPLYLWLVDRPGVRHELFDLYRRAIEEAPDVATKQYFEYNVAVYKCLAGNREKHVEYIRPFLVHGRSTGHPVEELFYKSLHAYSIPRIIETQWPVLYDTAVSVDINRELWTAEKVRMGNSDGPPLNVYTPVALWWNPGIEEYSPYNFTASSIRVVIKDLYDNPFRPTHHRE